MKPIMWLDESLPLTQWAPINPATNDVWVERYERLQELATLYRYQGKDDEEEAKEWKAEYEALKEGVEFRQVPYFVHITYACGSLAFKGKPPDGPIPGALSCHPTVWAELHEAVKDKYFPRVLKQFKTPSLEMKLN